MKSRRYEVHPKGCICEPCSDIPKLSDMPALKMKGYYVIKGAKHEGENQKED